MEQKEIWKCNNCNQSYNDILRASSCCRGMNKVDWNKKKDKK